MNKEKAFLGIDPGRSGAAAIIAPDEIDIMDYSNSFEVAQQFKEWKEDYDLKCILEKVWAIPGGGRKQGASSMFKFGENFGIYQGILSALGIPFLLVTPQKWQKAMLSDSDELTTKKRSLDVARRRYPSIATKFLKRQRDHDRADALMIATFANHYEIKA